MFNANFFEHSVCNLDIVFDSVDRGIPIDFSVVDSIQADRETLARIRAFILKRGYQPNRGVYCRVETFENRRI